MFEQIESAAPLLARHASAYGELIADDVLSAWQGFARRLWVGIVLIMAIMIALLLACTWLIAYSWDTPDRLGTIGALAGLFCAVSIVAGVVMFRLQSKPMRLLDLTRQELDKDRLLVEDLVPKAPAGAH